MTLPILLVCLSCFARYLCGDLEEQGAELHVTWRCNATILYRGCSLQFFYQPGSWSLGVGVGGTNSVSAPNPLFPPRTLLTVRQLHIPTFANAL